MAKIRDDVRITDKVVIDVRRRDGGGGTRRVRGAPPVGPIDVRSNLTLSLREEPHGKIVDQRKVHNIFTDYGREWISELISLDTGATPFRSDRVRYMGFGIGGTNQSIESATLRGTWAGFPNHWGYTNPLDPTTGGYGHDGTPGSGDPTQDETDPTITGLEYPVQVTSTDYFDEIVLPATFPEAGTVRFTAVLGYNQVSFGSATSVPLSEIGLFTESRQATRDEAPLPQDREVIPAPPLGVRYMVAYNTFDVISKTSALVLQVDWEIRFA